MLHITQKEEVFKASFGLKENPLRLCISFVSLGSFIKLEAKRPKPKVSPKSRSIIFS